MRDMTSGPRQDASLHFDRATLHFLVVCEAHSLSYTAETTFDARLLLDLHNKAHADPTSNLYLEEPAVAETKEELRGRLLKGLREGLGLTVTVAASLAGVTPGQVVAAEEGRLSDGLVEGALSVTYATVAAGLSNARRA